MTFEKDDIRQTELPDMFALTQSYPGESSIMQKRNSPAALRFHKVKQDNDSERYIFGEVMLYYPLVKEIDMKEARNLYGEMYKGKRKVDIVKSQVMDTPLLVN